MTNKHEPAIRVDADMSGFTAAMKTARESTSDFGRVFSATLRSAAITGKSFEDTVRSIAMRLSTLALNKAMAPVENALSGVMNGILSGLARPMTNSLGNAFGSGGPLPFAKGGVVSSPSLFSFAGGTGLMGEAGAEAVLPLSRGPDGRLGVASGQGQTPVNVVFNVQTSDVASFRRSESQLTTMLARTVQRGQRKL